MTSTCTGELRTCHGVNWRHGFQAEPQAACLPHKPHSALQHQHSEMCMQCRPMAAAWRVSSCAGRCLVLQVCLPLTQALLRCFLPLHLSSAYRFLRVSTSALPCLLVPFCHPWMVLPLPHLLPSSSLLRAVLFLRASCCHGQCLPLLFSLSESPLFLLLYRLLPSLM